MYGVIVKWIYDWKIHNAVQCSQYLIGPLYVFSFQIYVEAASILKYQSDGLCETVNPIVKDTSGSIPYFSLQPPAMADIAEVALSDKSDKEEDC